VPVQYEWRDQKESTKKSNEGYFIWTLHLHLDGNDVVTPLDDQIGTLNHVFTQNGVFLEVWRVFGDKGGELLLGCEQTLYIQRFQIVQSESFFGF